MKLLLEEKNEEIISWRQRETANEDYTSRLARKLDRLMVENQNRAQKDLRERMNLLDDKNRLSVENANLKRQLEELGARLKVDAHQAFHPNPNIPIINGEPAYRDIPDVKDDWYEELEDNKYREVLNIQSQIEAINNEIAFLQKNKKTFPSRQLLRDEHQSDERPFLYTRPHSPGRELDVVDYRHGYHQQQQQQPPNYESYVPEYPVYLNSSGSNLDDSNNADLDGSDTSGDKNIMKVRFRFERSI